ncbi:MAG: DUF3343 domain-containing protein [Lachnospirales bacterium]
MSVEIYYIVTFSGTHQAMASEEVLKKTIDCRLVPIPSELFAGCGMVLKVSDYKDVLESEVVFSKIYKVEKNGFSKEIEEIIIQ